MGKGKEKGMHWINFPNNISFALSGSKDSWYNALHLSHMLPLYELIYSYNKTRFKNHSGFFFYFTKGFSFE